MKLAAGAIISMLVLSSCQNSGSTSDTNRNGDTVDLGGVEYYTGDELVPPGTGKLNIPDGAILESDEGQGLNDIVSSRDRLRRESGGRGGGRAPKASDFNLADEKAIGEATARSLISTRRPLPPEHPLSNYVRLVGALITDRTTRPEVPYVFIVVDSREINAFAAPYGFIFVTTGLLRFLESESELAFVLAHEVAHVERKHGLEQLVLGWDEGKKRAAQRRLNELAPIDSKAFDELQAQMNKLSERWVQARGRPHETESDRDALARIRAIGYSPRGAAGFLTRMAKISKSRQPKLFQTHDPPAERLATVRAFTSRYGDSGKDLAERYKASVSSLR